VCEANAIGTAHLSPGFIAVNDQPELRRWIREYLNTRLCVYEKLPDAGRRKKN
jgi:hypothetical protein